MRPEVARDDGQQIMGAARRHGDQRELTWPHWPCPSEMPSDAPHTGDPAISGEHADLSQRTELLFSMHSTMASRAPPTRQARRMGRPPRSSAVQVRRVGLSHHHVRLRKWPGAVSPVRAVITGQSLTVRAADRCFSRRSNDGQTILEWLTGSFKTTSDLGFLVGAAGFEPATPRL
jgi:hypothetical protein